MNVRATAEGDHLRRLIWWSSLVAFLAIIQYASRAASGKPDRNVLYQYSTAVGTLVLYLIMLAVILAIAGFRRDLFALRKPRSWRRATGLMLALILGVYATIGLLEPILHGGREQGLTPSGWQPSHAGAFATNFFLIAGVIPVIEEMMFRGLGFSLLERYGKWTAILIVGITFGLAHGLVYGLPELALFGCALAWLRSQTDSVYPGMILHGTFNAIALIASVTI